MADSSDGRITRSSPDPLLAPTADTLLLVSAKEASRMCGKSLRTWRAWDAAGWIPRPVRIGRSTLWSVQELRDWIAAGCPRRHEWDSLNGRQF
jgi:predicted DNA-binding transcriptional regulator AlpA